MSGLPACQAVQAMQVSHKVDGQEAEVL